LAAGVVGSVVVTWQWCGGGARRGVAGVVAVVAVVGSRRREGVSGVGGIEDGMWWWLKSGDVARP
jgi:hypothetical protein